MLPVVPTDFSYLDTIGIIPYSTDQSKWFSEKNNCAFLHLAGFFPVNPSFLKELVGEGNSDWPEDERLRTDSLKQKEKTRTASGAHQTVY